MFKNLTLLAVLVVSLFLAVQATSNVVVVSTKPHNLYSLNATAYSPSEDETDSTPYETALMTKPTQGWTVAVSRDLMRYLGKKVYIEGLGIFRVEDLMNPRFTKRIDIFKDKKQTALKFGKKAVNCVFY